MKMTAQKVNYSAVFLVGALGAIVALIVVALIAYGQLDIVFLEAKKFADAARCSTQEGQMWCLFDDKWDSGTYLSVITGFYSVIIALLIGFLGVAGVFAFVVIRLNALSFAEEEIEKETRRVLSSEKIRSIFGKDIRSAVAEEVSGGVKERMDEIERILEEMGYPVSGKLEVDE